MVEGLPVPPRTEYGDYILLLLLAMILLLVVPRHDDTAGAISLMGKPEAGLLVVKILECLVTTRSTEHGISSHALHVPPWPISVHVLKAHTNRLQKVVDDFLPPVLIVLRVELLESPKSIQEAWNAERQVGNLKQIPNKSLVFRKEGVQKTQGTSFHESLQDYEVKSSLENLPSPRAPCQAVRGGVVPKVRHAGFVMRPEVEVRDEGHWGFSPLLVDLPDKIQKADHIPKADQGAVVYT
jgi:hypothetical protein